MLVKNSPRSKPVLNNPPGSPVCLSRVYISRKTCAMGNMTRYIILGIPQVIHTHIAETLVVCLRAFTSFYDCNNIAIDFSWSCTSRSISWKLLWLFTDNDGPYLEHVLIAPPLCLVSFINICVLSGKYIITGQNKNKWFILFTIWTKSNA